MLTGRRKKLRERSEVTSMRKAAAVTQRFRGLFFTPRTEASPIRSRKPSTSSTDPIRCLTSFRIKMQMYREIEIGTARLAAWGGRKGSFTTLHTTPMVVSD